MISPITSERRISKLLKELKNSVEKNPHQFPTWSIEQLLIYFNTWGSNEDLPLKFLAKKAATLLALSTSWRPKSELLGIQRS
ncbi:hypothetical protein AYI70_g7378 [Smittium culicis]|uniref:Uncharacterized protein n=1 Tax=Smittium culicis TaxID=133412 RepID=A0A1R1XKY3_9FUNG|nr:hypothetical protein AYI70_g7378 [Smittium culicis]